MKSKSLLLGLALGQALGLSALADDWPQWLGAKRDGVWRESGILKEFPDDGPKVNWRVPIGGGYAGPAVAKGKVYVTDRQLAKDATNPDNQFARGHIPGSERVICLDEKTGRQLWMHEYDCGYTVSYPAGPRTTPTVDGDRVYTLGAEGNLLCLNADSGKVLWQKDFKTEYGVKTPVWGFAAHPLVRGGHLICLARGDGSTVVCYDKLSGKEVWRSLTAKEPGYCPPTLIHAGGVEQLIIWHPGVTQLAQPGHRRGLLVGTVPGAFRPVDPHPAPAWQPVVHHRVLQRVDDDESRPGQTSGHAGVEEQARQRKKHARAAQHHADTFF